MKKLGNVLYIMTEGSHLHCDNGTISVKIGGSEKVRIPAHTIEAIICLCNTTVSTPFIGFCGENGISLSFHSDNGKFYGRIYGPVNGNVLLRKKQYQLIGSDQSADIVRNILCGKILNSRNFLLKAARGTDEDKAERIKKAAQMLLEQADLLENSADIDSMRGIEGAAASIYFQVFDDLLKTDEADMLFEKRSRRPPENSTNAMLSLLYTLLTLNCIAALETFGLDSYMGYLHELHPGRESLAMDLIEEFRAPLVDRFVLNLINRGQIKKDDFERTPGGVMLCKSSRKKLLELWEKEKEINVLFPLFKKPVPKKMLPYLQAQLMSQFIRGDIEEYPPWSWRP